MGMKRKKSSRGGTEQFKRIKLSVQEFVEKAEGEGSGARTGGGSGARTGGGSGARTGGGSDARRGRPPGFPAIRKKSRKELRKNERRSKKIRKKAYNEMKFSGKQGAQGATEKNKKGAKASHPAGKKPAAPGKKRRLKKAAKERLDRSEMEEARKKSLQEANEMEEREIRRLEKSLKMNKRKNKSSLPQAFTQDGLDYILGVLEPGGATVGLYDEEEEEEANTAEKLLKLSEQVDEDSDGGEGSDMGEDGDGGEDSDMGEDGGEGMEEEGPSEDEELSEEDAAMEESGEEDAGEEDDQPGGTSEASDDEDVEEPKTKTSVDPDNKYVPPHLRESSEAADTKRREALERLRKRVKGLMNRLSEPNMSSICGQLEELYMTNSRKDMSDTLSTVVLNACITPAKMPDRLMMEHVLLISILHHTVGIEVGAHMLETVVKQFHDQHEHITDSKECDNLITFIGHLYNFHIIDSRLVFDILKMLVSTFTEKNIELVLLLLKNVGFSLRKDDALSLKELICEAQNKAGAVDKEFRDQSRVRFMLEIMLALKNNDMRKIPGYDPEPVEKLRKLQRSLINNSNSGTDTRLRVSLENILEADKVGRWWIVGSSWSGAPMIGQPSDKASTQAAGKVGAKIMELARKQRMNTDIRRNIFCVVMTSEDYLDAFEKLLKLGLKDQQEREIVHVLIDCCLQEKTYNPFYAFLSSKFCDFDRRFQMTFQFSMWDKFRDLGRLSATTFSNLILFLSHLIKSKSLPLSIFKVIEFSELDKVKVSFLRQVLSKLLMESEPDQLAVIFGKISNNPKLGMLQEGLKLFISHFLLKNIHAQNTAEEAELLMQKADLAVKALQAKQSKLRL